MKQVAADANSMAVARYRAAQHNTYGSGEVIGTWITIVLLYSLEFVAFIGSFDTRRIPALATAIYGGLTIFGFEVFDRMGCIDVDAEEVS